LRRTMRPLAAVERFLERLFERSTNRIFHARIQPVQLQRRIERAMETDRLSGADRTLVPNRYVLRLHPDDLAEFGDFSATLASELADGALGFARAHHYTLVDRPRVDLVADEGLTPGEIAVDARFIDPRAPDEVAEADGSPEADAPALSTDTMVFTRPDVGGRLAVLREIRPDGTQRELDIDGGMLSIGRASDNGLVLHDSRVSRYHARLQARRGTLVFTDLGSTNGSRVNGVPVEEVAVGEGDRLQIGDTVLVVESLPPD
jgi:hypothetical protein